MIRVIATPPATVAEARRAVAEDAGPLGSEVFAISRKHFNVLHYWRSFGALGERVGAMTNSRGRLGRSRPA